MGDLSQHFDRSEFACKCDCGQVTVDHELIVVLEWLRVKTGARITVTSGNRCKAHNKAIGGANASKHLYSIAADIKVEGYSPALIHRLLDEKFPHKYGLKAYKSWTHIDVRPCLWRG